MRLGWGRQIPAEGAKIIMKSFKFAAVAGAIICILAATGCDKLKARDQINKGVASFKNAQYERATEHFKDAVALDPSLQNARLYLAAAYTAQYIPGVESPDNLQIAQNAIEQYQTVL